MQLVILAAGHGTRFGGLKQLAPVGPTGQAIMDYTALSADRCQFDGVVVVVRDEIRVEISSHIKAMWTTSMGIEIVCQPPLAGTAYAVLAARPVINGPFAVANADDLYGDDALSRVHAYFAGIDSRKGADRQDASSHLLVGYELDHTVFGSAPVKRGLCEIDRDGALRAIVEHTFEPLEDGTYRGTPLAGATLPTDDGGATASPQAIVVRGDAVVSMNLWGFHPRFFDQLEAAVARSASAGPTGGELLLPSIVGSLVETGKDSVFVVTTKSMCRGITHAEDLSMVRDAIEKEGPDQGRTEAVNGY